MRHKVILQVYDSEEEFHHILLLYFFPFMGKLSLEGCLDLIPTILELKAEIFLSNVEHFCDLIDCDFKDTVGISTVFWFFCLGIGGLLLGEKVFYVRLLFFQHRIQFVHGFGEVDHRTWNIPSFFDVLSHRNHVFDFIFDFLRIVCVHFY